MNLGELPGGGALGAVGHHRAGLLPARQPKSTADQGALQGAEKIVTNRLLSDRGLPELKRCNLPSTWGLPGHRDCVPHLPPPQHTHTHTHQGS